MKKNFKISQFSRFLLRSVYALQVKICYWLKLLNSVPFIKKTLLDQVYIRIWSFWLTFTVLQWMKKNSKISQFSSFLLRSGYPIYSLSDGFWQSFVSIEVCRDRKPALAWSCKKTINGFLCLPIVFPES